MNDEPQTLLPEAMGLHDAAGRLGCSYRTLKRAIDVGQLRASQLTKGRGGWVVQRDDLLAYVDAKATRGQGRPIQPEVRAPRRRRPAPAGRMTVTESMGKVA